jgi:hypothetical protein
MFRRLRSAASWILGPPFVESRVLPSDSFLGSGHLLMKNYAAPQLTQYGSISEITGIFGGPAPSDVLVNPNGEIVQEGEQSINACPTIDFEQCYFE